jgi:hypothetical protein
MSALPKLTQEQAIILTGFTGVCCISMEAFHQDLERRLQRSVFSHELGKKDFVARVKELYREDFLAILPSEITKG